MKCDNSFAFRGKQKDANFVQNFVTLVRRLSSSADVLGGVLDARDAMFTSLHLRELAARKRPELDVVDVRHGDIVAHGHLAQRQVRLDQEAAGGAVAMPIAVRRRHDRCRR